MRRFLKPAGCFRHFHKHSLKFLRLALLSVAALALPAHAQLNSSPSSASGWHSLTQDASSHPQAAEVALYLPWPVFSHSLTALLENYTTSDQENLGDQTISVNGLNWAASDVTSMVASSFIPGAMTSNSYSIQSKNLQLALSVGKLSIDQVVLKTVGSTTVKVHIQAVCGPIQMTQTAASAHAVVSYQFSDSALKTDITQFNLSWAPNSWSVSQISCQGPAGLDQELQTALMQQFQSADAFRASIQARLADKIQAQVGGLIEQMKKPTSLPVEKSPIPLQLSFSRFQSAKSGLIIFGILDWSGGIHSSQPRALPMPDVPQELQNSTTPQLISLNRSWEDVLEAELSAYGQDTAFNMNQQESFQNLLESRVKQWLVWPDLANYTGESSFTFLLHTPKVQDINWQADGSAIANVQSGGWIQSERELPDNLLGDLKKWNYVELTGTGQAEIRPSISHGLLRIRAQATNTDLHAQFGEEYVKTFDPNTFLGATLLRQLKASLETPITEELPLPSVQLGPLGEAKFNGWNPISNGRLAIPIEEK